MRGFPLKLTDRSRSSRAGAVADLVDTNRALIICPRCETRMGLKQPAKRGYWRVPGLHAAQGQCDYCQAMAGCNLYVPEGGGYHQQVANATGTWGGDAELQSRARIRVRDRRRVR